jgi:hypothetical protein
MAEYKKVNCSYCRTILHFNINKIQRELPQKYVKFDEKDKMWTPKILTTSAIRNRTEDKRELFSEGERKVTSGIRFSFISHVCMN